MTQYISDSIRTYFSKEFIGALAMNLDEPVPAVSKSLQAIVPSVLTALANKIHTGKEEGNRMYSLVSEAAAYYPKAPDVAKLQNAEAGSSLPYDIFGKNEHSVARHVAAWSGVRPGSAEQLLTLATPVIAGIIGDNFHKRNLSSTEFRNEFSTNDEVLQQMLPEGYILPDTDVPLSTIRADNANIRQADTMRNKTNFVFPKWIPVAVVILAVLLLIFFSRL